MVVTSSALGASVTSQVPAVAGTRRAAVFRRRARVLVRRITAAPKGKRARDEGDEADVDPVFQLHDDSALSGM